ncbi:MAG: site-specific integrase, partial [Lachnospiraceae bacterium]|nr:site-specific integrase [Lachnospiraceae bacterium]
MDYIVTEDRLTAFQRQLQTLGKSPSTIEKYNRDINKLAAYLQGRTLTQSTLDGYVAWLREQGFKPSSIQSYLSIVRVFCDLMHWEGIR